MVRRALKIAIPVALVALVAAAVWLVFTGSRAVAAVTDLRAAVDNVKIAVDETDLPALQQAARDAQDAATRADDALDGPVWAVVAAIPYAGDSAEVARVTAAALATASDGLTPLLDVADVLDPASLYADGRIDVDRLHAAQQPLGQAATAVEQAAKQIATSPTADDGAWVPASLDNQRAEAADQLDEAAEALTKASAAAEVMPALLGSKGPRTWFVGLQTPAEARGTGGLPGNFVVLTAEDGRLALETTGSNDDMQTLPALPDFGEDYRARYGQDPRLFNNSNLSPHFPYAGQLWRTFYADSFDGDASVVAGMDVVALGSLVEAIGTITLPDGQTLGREDVVDFFLRGVYTDFPDRDERKAFQEAVTSTVFGELTSGQVEPTALVGAFAELISQGRLQLWSPNEDEQGVLVDLPTAGSITAEPGPYAYPVVIDASGSKLNAYLERDWRYDVGRCPIDGRVESVLTLTLTSDIPADEPLDPFVIGTAEVTPQGPVASVQFQVHLAPDAQVTSVEADGEPVPVFRFVEQGRPSVLAPLDLPPRQPVTITVEFTEPAETAEALLPVQPLAREATAEVVDVGCDTPTPSLG